MSVLPVVLRLELASKSCDPLGFAYDDMIEGDAEVAEGNTGKDHVQEERTRNGEEMDMNHEEMGGMWEERDGDQADIDILKHIGCRQMRDIAIETFIPVEQSDEVAGCTEETGGSSQSDKTVTQVTSQACEVVPFYSGNPAVETVHGIMHLYKTSQPVPLSGPARRSCLLAMLSVPAWASSRELLSFLAPVADSLRHLKVVRDSTPNQYMLLLLFHSLTAADEFYTEFNGRRFSSLEEETCHLVYVKKAETVRSDQGASMPVMGLTELPPCIICLERMDEAVSGVLTILCNHSFHSTCLQPWADTTCPVCRYCQTPEPTQDNHCFVCGVQENLWICLVCGHIGCGRYESRHAHQHFEETQHTYALQLCSQRVWDYAGDNYVHRLVACKTDGKMVQFDQENSAEQDEKLEALQLEYSYLLSSQLESQREFWEGKVTRLEQEAANEMRELKDRFKETIMRCEGLEQQLAAALREKQMMEKKVAQLSTRSTRVANELQEELELGRCLRANQTEWAEREAMMEKDREAERLAHQAETTELREQVRDLMFCLDTREKVNCLPAEEKADVREGVVEAIPSPSPNVQQRDRGTRRSRGRKHR
uniref:BRCA1 associated protein n=1 Tax=Eptatretus burgeri TaxID=7764 RepID=A0A8C4WUR0_EPTBU